MLSKKGYIPPGEVSAKRSIIAMLAAGIKGNRGRVLSPERYKEIVEKRRRTSLSRKGVCMKNNIAPHEPRTLIKILRSTRDTLHRCAYHDNKTIIMFMQDFAAYLRSHPRYAHMFTTQVVVTQAEPQTGH